MIEPEFVYVNVGIEWNLDSIATVKRLRVVRVVQFIMLLWTELGVDVYAPKSSHHIISHHITFPILRPLSSLEEEVQ